MKGMLWMFTYFFRGASTAIAIIFTIMSIGISYFSTSDQSGEIVFHPAEDVPLQENTAVNILQNREEIGLTLQQAFDLYSNKMTKNVQFSIQTVANEADYHSTLRAKLLAKDGADLFHISGARELSELEKHVRELDFLPWAADAYTVTLDAVKRDNKIFGVPYSIEGFGFICNRDMFDTAGISLEDIRSFEDLKKAFAEFNDKIISGELRENFEDLEAVCEFPAQDKGFIGGYFADIAMTGAFESPEEAALSQTVSFPAADSVEELVKLIAKYSTHNNDWPKIAEITDARQIERFANGRVAVILQDTNVYLRVNEINSGMQGRAFLLPVPLDAYEQPAIYTGVPAYWAINTASGEDTAKAAGDFLTWLYDDPEGAEYFANNFEAVSPYRKYAVSAKAVLQSQMLNYLDSDMSLPQLHREFPQSWGKDSFASNVRSYFTDREKTWEQVIKDSEDGWSAVS